MACCSHGPLGVIIQHEIPLEARLEALNSKTSLLLRHKQPHVRSGDSCFNAQSSSGSGLHNARGLHHTLTWLHPKVLAAVIWGVRRVLHTWRPSSRTSVIVQFAAC